MHHRFVHLITLTLGGLLFFASTTAAQVHALSSLVESVQTEAPEACADTAPDFGSSFPSTTCVDAARWSEDNIVWGTIWVDVDNIVWGTMWDDTDNIVWGTGSFDGSLEWNAMGADDNIVWGTMRVDDNIVWGTGASPAF